MRDQRFRFSRCIGLVTQKNCLFVFKILLFTGSNYPKNAKVYFEDEVTDVQSVSRNETRKKSTFRDTFWSARNYCMGALSSVSPFQPKYRQVHPENYLLSSSKKHMYRIKVSKKTTFNLILKKALPVCTTCMYTS